MQKLQKGLSTFGALKHISSEGMTVLEGEKLAACRQILLEMLRDMENEPVIEETYREILEDDMDINAGRIITEGASLQDIRQEILACIERTASGIPTKSECLGHQEYSLGYKSFCAISSQ